jgi:DNA-binding XRE family transcriptional regulator
MPRKNNTNTLDEFVGEQYGTRGTSKRERFEKGYEQFKLGVLIQEARLEKGLTQEQLAEKCGTNRAYISKVENNVKDVSLSTLRKIIEVGLGGQLELSIKL